MIIACPNCSARYDIDDSRFLPGGRSVRCSECSTSWFVPAPQSVETLMPSARVDEEQKREDDSLFAPRPPQDTQQNTDQNIFKRRRADHADTSHNGGQGAQDQPRPKWGPMAERRSPENEPASDDPRSMWKTPRRRANDTVVDTDWQEVRKAVVENARERAGHDHEDGRDYQPGKKGRTVLSPLSPERNKSGARIGFHGNVVTPDDVDAPHEVFASVNVQPRELERALKKVRRKAEARDKNRLTPMRLLGWLGLFAVVGSLLYGGYHYRDDIVRVAPGSAKVYASVGIDASPYGLNLKNINHRVGLATTGPIVEIFGELHNQSDKSISPPLLQAEAVDVHGKLLASWTFSPDEAIVAGNGMVSFSTKAPAPDGIVEVVLSFAPEKGQSRAE